VETGRFGNAQLFIVFCGSALKFRKVDFEGLRLSGISAHAQIQNNYKAIPRYNPPKCSQFNLVTY
jgi:hypothetical protein